MRREVVDERDTNKNRPLGVQRLFRVALLLLTVLIIIPGILISWGWLTMIQMPGESYRGELPPLTQKEVALRDALQRDIETLGSEIGERNFLHYKQLMAAADFLDASFAQAGYKVQRQGYTVNNQTYYNLEVEIPGTQRADEIVIIGGHYDSVSGSPGANDNGTGAAATLELARLFAGKKPERTLRFVEFVNEEPPFSSQKGWGVWFMRLDANSALKTSLPCSVWKRSGTILTRSVASNIPCRSYPRSTRSRGISSASLAMSLPVHW